jgi:broad specificity phosphatase PhoE
MSESMISLPRGNIFLMRHEQRGISTSFETPLTQRGKENAATIICQQLEQNNIDVIYSSPFVRVLQTIQPFCRKTGINVNLEWSLVESMPVDPIVSDNFNDIVNKDYLSFAKYSCPLTSDMLLFDVIKLRMKKFIKSIDCSKNILLVTHMPVINAVLSCYGFGNIEMYTHHEPGTIILINELFHIQHHRKKKNKKYMGK